MCRQPENGIIRIIREGINPTVGPGSGLSPSGFIAIIHITLGGNIHIQGTFESLSEWGVLKFFFVQFYSILKYP